MFNLPDKFSRNPFFVWGFLVATVAVFVFLFGKEEIMDISRQISGKGPVVGQEGRAT